MELKNNGKLNFIIDLFLDLENYMSGGLVSLHKLAYKLADKGHNVYIFCKPNYPHKNITVVPSKVNIVQGHQFNCTWEEFSYNLNTTVSIYPEHSLKNKFNTIHNVRWIMYHTTKKDEENFSDSDYIFNFGNFETHIERNDGKLTVIDYNLDKFFIQNNNRKGYCHILSKKTPNNHEEILNKFNSIDMTNFHNKCDLYQLGVEFNKYEYFLTFDDKTYLTTAAALCGCKVIILNTGQKNFTPLEYKLQTPTNMFGVAYGLDDLKWAEDTIHLVRDHIIEMEKIDKKTVNNFINFWENKCYG